MKLILYKPNGCEKCGNKGYRGRTGIHELLVVDEKVQELIHGEHSESDIEQHIRKTTPSIRQDGLMKFAPAEPPLKK